MKSWNSEEGSKLDFTTGEDLAQLLSGSETLEIPRAYKVAFGSGSVPFSLAVSMPLSYGEECGLAFWKASSECSVLLALNRCLEMLKPSWAAVLFDGRRTFLWLGLSSVHYLWGVFYATPLVWTSLYVTMVFNPHAGYLDVDEAEVR